jgi:TonB family protein
MSELVLNAALKGTVVLAAAWIATLLLRRSPADLRHSIWLAALACMPLFMLPAQLPEAARISVAAAADTDALARAAARSAPLWPMVWGAGALLLLARFAAGVFRLSRWTRASQLAGDVHVSDAVSSPLTWGLLRPVILLPEYAMEWTPAKRSLAIRHERAHVARRDWLWQSAAQIVAAVFWFHPLVWLAAARLRQEAEQAADDAVLASGAEAADYAAQLVEVARYVRRPALGAAVPMVRRPELTGRVASILDATRPRNTAGAGSRMAVAFVALCCVPLLAAFQDGTVYPVGNGVSAPVPIYKPEPEYSEEAREAKYQGAVTVTLIVDEHGLPKDINIVKKLGMGLDEQAVKTIEQWRFKPAMKDGAPVQVRVTIEMIFRLL